MDALADGLHAVAGAEGAARLQPPAGILGLAECGDHPRLPAAWPTRPVFRIDKLARELLLKALSVLAFGSIWII